MVTTNPKIAAIANVHAGAKVAKKSGMSPHAVLFVRALMRMGLRSCQAGWSFEEMRILGSRSEMVGATREGV